jgi:hypothetical protein
MYSGVTARRCLNVLLAVAVFVLLVTVARPLQAIQIVRFNYVASLETITGNPFGLTSPNDLDKLVTGFFQYDADTAAASQIGAFSDYPHSGGGGFEAALPNGIVITGSVTPHLRTEVFTSPTNDTLEFHDGPHAIRPGGTMFRDSGGGPALDANILLNLRHSADLLDDAALPNPYPFSVSDPHTFTIEETGSTGILSLQFTEITMVPEPSSVALALAGALCLIGAWWRRCLRR